MRPASVGGIATITRWPFAFNRPEYTVTPSDDCSMRSTGLPSITLPPSWPAIASAIVCAPPTKRLSCAPPAVLKLRSNVPVFCSSPDAAM